MPFARLSFVGLILPTCRISPYSQIHCLLTPPIGPRVEMVYIGIPKNYTTSPSSFMGTPSLTINHEATQDLDSSNAFEGTC